MTMNPQRLSQMRRTLAQAFRATNDLRLKPATRQKAHALLTSTKRCLDLHAQRTKPPNVV